MLKMGVCHHYYKARTEDNEEQKSSTQFCKNCEVVLKLSQNCLRVVSKSLRNFLKAVLKLFQSCPKVVDVWAWRMASMWDGIEI